MSNNKVTLIVHLFELEGKIGSQRRCGPLLCLAYPHQYVCTSGPDHYDNASELPEVMRHQNVVWLNVNFKLTFDNMLIWFHMLGEQMIKASQTLIPSAFGCKHRGRSVSILFLSSSQCRCLVQIVHIF